MTQLKEIVAKIESQIVALGFTETTPIPNQTKTFTVEGVEALRRFAGQLGVDLDKTGYTYQAVVRNGRDPYLSGPVIGTDGTNLCIRWGEVLQPIVCESADFLSIESEEKKDREENAYSVFFLSVYDEETEDELRIPIRVVEGAKLPKPDKNIFAIMLGEPTSKLPVEKLVARLGRIDSIVRLSNLDDGDEIELVSSEERTIPAKEEGQEDRTYYVVEDVNNVRYYGSKEIADKIPCTFVKKGTALIDDEGTALVFSNQRMKLKELDLTTSEGTGEPYKVVGYASYSYNTKDGRSITSFYVNVEGVGEVVLNKPLINYVRSEPIITADEPAELYIDRKEERTRGKETFTIVSARLIPSHVDEGLGSLIDLMSLSSGDKASKGDKTEVKL